MCNEQVWCKPGEWHGTVCRDVQLVTAWLDTLCQHTTLLAMFKHCLTNKVIMNQYKFTNKKSKQWNQGHKVISKGKFLFEKITLTQNIRCSHRLHTSVATLLTLATLLQRTVITQSCQLAEGLPNKVVEDACWLLALVELHVFVLLVLMVPCMTAHQLIAQTLLLLSHYNQFRLRKNRSAIRYIQNDVNSWFT